MLGFLISAIPTLQRPIIRFMKLLPSSINVIIFIVFMTVFFGTMTMIIFNKQEEFYDTDDAYMSYNYTSYHESLYSFWQIGLNNFIIYDQMMFFFDDNWCKFGYFFFVYFIYKFILPNFLVGALTAKFKLTYN